VRIPRKDRTGMNPLKAGLILLVVAGAATYFGFAKHIPFTHGFQVKAVFESANSIRLASPVRIAGVNVGKVKRVERYKDTDMALVTMEIDDKGLPIHKDATLKIRPRIFLEGNYFVDIKPGTPSAATLESGDTIKVTQTATPVQLDQLLGALQTDSRQDLKDLLDGYGGALTHKPTRAEDATQDPSVRGQTGAEALNGALDYGKPAFKGSAIVNTALRGSSPRDLPRLIAAFGRVAAALATSEDDLKGFISNFNTTTAAFAARQADLRASIRELGPTLQVANRTFDHLNAAFPDTRAFAREILPGVRETPATLDASLPWIAQVRGLVGRDELGGLSVQLRALAPELARTAQGTIGFLPEADALAQCTSKILVPSGNVVLDDGALSSGAANYKEFWYTIVGFNGEGQNFDGNGSYIRFQSGGGATPIASRKIPGQADRFRLVGNAALAPLGTRPKYPGKLSPVRKDVPCAKNQAPDLNGPAAAVGPGDEVLGATTTRTATAPRARGTR